MLLGVTAPLEDVGDEMACSMSPDMIARNYMSYPFPLQEVGSVMFQPASLRSMARLSIGT